MTDTVHQGDKRATTDDDIKHGEVLPDAARIGAARGRYTDSAREAGGVGVEAEGAGACADDLPIARYDTLTAQDIAGKLSALSQIDLATIDAYERRNENRNTIIERIIALRSSEPCAGYDRLTVDEIRALLDEADDDLAQKIRSYERDHKDRVGVLKAADSELAGSDALKPR